MNNYRNFEVEDFLDDEFFLEWVLNSKPEHNRFWETWLVKNPDKASAVSRAAAIIRSLKLQPNQKQLSDDDIALITERFLHETARREPAKISRLSYRWLSVAAVLILAVGVSLLLFRKNNVPPAVNTAATAPALVKTYNSSTHPRLVQLSDGTMVVLKTRSEVVYPKEFNTTTREVTLKGEAFFEVRKNPAKPFLVHTGNMVTKVLGTSFTVRAYDDDKEFNVIVNTGRVQVYDKRKNADGKGTDAVLLSPNLQAMYRLENASFKKEAVKVPLMLSPKLAGKEFMFNNAPLPVIMTKLEQAYGVTIHYDKAKYADVTVTASLSKLPLDEKVRAICKATGAIYEFKDGQIAIK